MMKEEFEARCRELNGGEMNHEPTNAEYAVIEEVYTFHPSIGNTTGKEQIAMLYMNFGMPIIYDMVPRARKMRALIEKQDSIRIEMQRIKDEIQECSSGLVR